MIYKDCTIYESLFVTHKTHSITYVFCVCLFFPTHTIYDQCACFVCVFFVTHNIHIIKYVFCVWLFSTTHNIWSACIFCVCLSFIILRRPHCDTQNTLYYEYILFVVLLLTTHKINYHVCILCVVFLPTTHKIHPVICVFCGSIFSHHTQNKLYHACILCVVLLPNTHKIHSIMCAFCVCFFSPPHTKYDQCDQIATRCLLTTFKLWTCFIMSEMFLTFLYLLLQYSNNIWLSNYFNIHSNSYKGMPKSIKFLETFLRLNINV